ncbi:MAG: Cd(II)/Pb(II)-responsive transcriptional regulator, partial [Magnetococcales bacterium]|nr:Cd(II)/Pb(II)-responsive transcriptional regulator [Magnetococcales bacterium]
MRIGELAKQAGCDVETVRYYERDGLLAKPEREISGYRNYNTLHLADLQFVRHCRSLGMKLAEIKVLMNFRSSPDGDCAGVNALLDVQIVRVEEQMAAMSLLKEQLIALRNKCEHRRTNKECGIMQSLNYAVQVRKCP